jgi:hypothetical protein
MEGLMSVHYPGGNPAGEGNSGLAPDDSRLWHMQEMNARCNGLYSASRLSYKAYVLCCASG